MSSLTGFLGLKWGDDAGDAATRLGLSCERWERWGASAEYEACFDTAHAVEAFERKAYVKLFRHQHRLEALSLRFMQCGATRDELVAAVRQEFGLEDGDGLPYTVFADGAVAHLAYDSSDDSCTLTLAGPRFGQAFAADQLNQGFQNLAHGLRPH